MVFSSVRRRLQGSFEHALDEIARRGSWWGGGTVAAFSAALAAALAEKLAAQPSFRRRLHRIRQSCLKLGQADADAFADVIRATRSGSRRAFARSLKAATEVPYDVLGHARTIEDACRRLEREVRPQYRSDLRCASALARAAGASARGFIDTNLAWLRDPGYARRMRRRVAAAVRPHAG